jgi:hypothetical protein
MVGLSTLLIAYESHGWTYKQCQEQCKPSSQKCLTKAKADECERECFKVARAIVEECMAASSGVGATIEQEVRPEPPKSQGQSLPRSEVIDLEDRTVVSDTTSEEKVELREEGESTTERKIEEKYQQLKNTIDRRGALRNASPQEIYKAIVSNKHGNTRYEGGGDPESVIGRLASFIPYIINQEKQNPGYIPLYQSGAGAQLAFLKDLQNFIVEIKNEVKTGKRYQITESDSEPFFLEGKTAKFIRNDEVRYKTVQEFFRAFNNFRDIQSKSVDGGPSLKRIDHEPGIAGHLASVSLSLLDLDSNETAVGFFVVKPGNIGLKMDRTIAIVKDILNRAGIDETKHQKYLDLLLYRYKEKVHRCLIQFFVHERIAGDVLYLAIPFGNAVNFSEDFGRITPELIKNYQQMNSRDFAKYMDNLTIPRVTTIKNHVTREIIQARILMTSPKINPDTFKFVIYYDADHSIKELHQQLINYLREDLSEVLREEREDVVGPVRETSPEQQLILQ